MVNQDWSKLFPTILFPTFSVSLVALEVLRFPDEKRKSGLVDTAFLLSVLDGGVLTTAARAILWHKKPNIMEGQQYPRHTRLPIPGGK